jgi:hypothetical protein
MALGQLEALAGGELQRSFEYGNRVTYTLRAYSLPAELLCGQLAAAAELAVAAPEKFPELFVVLIASSAPQVLSALAMSHPILLSLSSTLKYV